MRPESSTRRRWILAAACGLAVALAPAPAAGQGVFLRGDCNQDDVLVISDVIFLLQFLFTGGRTPVCEAACDADANGGLDISDPIYTLGFLFLGGPPPPPPFPEPDVDDDGPLPCDNGRFPVVELRAAPPTVRLHRVGERRALRVVGLRSDGTAIELTGNDALRYEADPPGVVDIATDGVIAAAAVGRASITVSFRRVSVDVAVEVVAGADGSPRIVVAQPADGAVLAAASVTVSGWVNDPRARVEVLGAPVDTTAGGLFSRSVPLSPGTSAIEVTATNAAGSTTAAVEVTRIDPLDPAAVGPDGLPLPLVARRPTSPADTVAPRISISRPRDGEVLRTGRIEVAGSIDDAEAEVRVNGTLARIDGGTYTARVRLPYGAARITVVALDPAGNSARRSIEVTVGEVSASDIDPIAITEPPVAPLTRSELPEGFAWVTTSSVHVRGTLGFTATSVAVNGVAARIDGRDFEAEVPLAPGLQRVAAVAFDAGGARAVATRRVFRDTRAPRIELLAGEPAMTTAARITLAGRVTDDSTALAGLASITLELDGRPVPFARGRFAITAQLSPGENRLELTARDGAGRESRRTVVVVQGSADGLHLVSDSGDGQTARPRTTLPAPLAVIVRGADGSPVLACPVVFEVALGDGVLDGGARRVTAVSDSSGRAVAQYTTGRLAGPGVVRVHPVPRASAAIAMAVTTGVEGSAVSIVPRHDRWMTVVAGRASPIAVRAIDRSGNTVAGTLVTFEAISGEPILDGSTRRTVVADRLGVATVNAVLPATDGLVEVVARTGLASPVTFTLESRVPGAPGDTAVAGVVVDYAGRPVPGVEVRLVDAPAARTATDAAGRFEIEGAPAGEVAIDLLPPGRDRDGKPLAAARRVVQCVAGRHCGLPAPIVLPRRDDGGPAPSRIFVGERAGGRVSIPGLGGWRLDIPAGAAVFPGGGRSGWIEVVAASEHQLPAPPVDGTTPVAAAWILPEGVRFVEAPTLVTPSLTTLDAGAEPTLWSWSAESGRFFASAPGRIADGGVEVTTVAGTGPPGGGLHFFAVPGPEDGVTATVSGVVEPGPRLGGFEPQHPASPTAAEGVLIHSGELVVDEVDMSVRGRGLDFELRRHYESRQHFAGSLGFGWEHEYADRRLRRVSVARAEDEASGDLIRSDGRGRHDLYLRDHQTGSFASPLGVHATLFHDADGALVERTPDGTRYRYHPTDDGPLSGRLVRITDRRGNRLELVHDDAGRLREVVDTLGRRFTYEYDAAGLIESVTDFAGRTVRYGRDGAGNLTTVTTPAVLGTPNRNDFPAGKTVRLEYRDGVDDARLAGNLVAVFSGRESGEGGVPWLRVRYGESEASPEFDRVTWQRIGGRNATGVEAGGVYLFSYRLEDGAPDDGDLAATLLAEGGSTTIVDPRRVRREVVWNRLGLPVRDRVFSTEELGPRDATRRFPQPGVDPAFLDTTYRYTPDGLPLEVTHPGGGRVVYDYDLGSPLRIARARVRDETRFAPPGDPTPPIVTTTVRDPLFGEVVRREDWHVAGEPPPGPTIAVLDYQEGTTIATLAMEAGVTVDDLSAALARSGIELGLGDRNGDGVVDARSGDVVELRHPEVTRRDGTRQAAVETFARNRFGQLVEHVDAEGHVTRLRYHPENDPEGDGTTSGSPGLASDTGGYLAERIIDARVDGVERDTPFADLQTRFTYDRLGNEATVTDGLDHTTRLLHNERGQLIEATAPGSLRARRRFFWDADDRLARVEVENLSMTLDGFPVPVPDNPWIETRWERDILGRVVTEIAEVSAGEVGPARQARTSYRYDELGNLARVVDPDGNEERWLHDERGLPLIHAVVAADGTELASTELRHDLDGRLVVTVLPGDVDGDGERERIELVRDGHGRVRARVDELGGVTVRDLDAAGRLVGEAALGSPGGASPRGRDGAMNVLLARTRIDRDERGRVVRISRSRFGPGHPAGASPLVEERDVDALGRVVVVESGGSTWRFAYDGAGNLRRAVGPEGDSTLFDHDAAGRLVRRRARELSSAPVAADVAGDPDFDDTGRLVSIRSTVWARDPLGRVVAEIGPSGGTRRFVHDSRGNVVLVSDAVGTVIAASSDPVLSPILDLLADGAQSTVNAPGNRVRFERDNLGRTVRVIHELRENGQGGSSIDLGNPFNRDGLIETSYDWDGSSRLRAWRDDGGRQATIRRDAAGRIEAIDGPGPWSLVVRRDRAGNAREIVDRNGNVIRQQFDALGRLTRREVERNTSAGVEGTTLQLFEWDGLSRLTLAFDDNDPDDPRDDAVSLRRHDSLGRLVEESQNGFSTRIERDAAGRIAALRLPGGRLVEYGRDRAGRVLVVRDASRDWVSYLRSGAGRILERRLANGSRLGYLEPDEGGIPRDTSYRADGTVARHRWLDPAGEEIIDLELGHDRAGRRLFVRRLHLLTITGDAYRYDSIGRLGLFIPGVRDPRTPPLRPARFRRDLRDGDHNVRFTTVDFVDTTTSVDERNALIRRGDVTFETDRAGNLLDDGRRILRHDFLGRLVRVEVNRETVALHAYDAVGAESPEPIGPGGRAVLRRGPRGGPEGARRVVHVGQHAVEDRRLTGELLTEWILEPEGSVIAHAGADRSGQARAWFHVRDPRGTAVVLTDERGAVAELFRYDGQGRPRFFNASGAPTPRSRSGNRFLVASRPWDDSADAYVLGAGLLSPELGRSLTPEHPAAIDVASLPRAGSSVPATGPVPAFERVTRIRVTPARPAGSMPLAPALRAPSPLELNVYVRDGADPVNVRPMPLEPDVEAPPSSGGR